MKMENSTNNLGTLETEGEALGKAWRSRDRKDKNQFKVDIKNDGQFDPTLKRPSGLLVRTGFLMEQIKLGNTTKEKCGFKNLDRRRLSECLWFYENQKDCLAFISDSKKGYSNLSALQKAMTKSNRTEKSDDQESDASQTETTEGEVSDVGQSQLPTTKYDLAKEIMKTCQDNNINPLDLIDIILINVENQPKQSKNVVPMGNHKVKNNSPKAKQANA